MSLVDHDRAVVLVLELNDCWQISQVALHREHTVDDNELDSLLGQLLEHTLEVGHVVMLVVELTGKRETTAIDDTGVVAIVADDIVVLAYYHCQHTLIDGEAGREAQAVVLADELGDFLFQLDVQVERSVEEAATGTTRTVFVECTLGSVDDALVASQTCIGV